MDPRHGHQYNFMEFYSPGFGRLVQPKLYVQVRAPDAPSWSMRFSALVDTGASITLINEDRVSFQFGTLSVGAGQTVTKTFPEVGTFRNTCRLTPGQEVLITVY